MLYVMFEHGVTYVGSGCANDVWTTCDWLDDHESVGAQAGNRVYKASKARRSIWGAHWDLETGDRVECRAQHARS